MKPFKGPAGFNALHAIFQYVAPFTAADGRAFVRVPPVAGFGTRSFPLRSRAFREYFFDQCYTRLGTIPSSRDWNAVLRHLEAQSTRDPANTRIIVGRRVDSRGDKPVPDRILVHLANPQSQFVEITREGWELATSDTVHFEFSLPNRTLPTPQKTANPAAALETLRATLNLSGPDWRRAIAWLLNAFRSEGPFPILILRGPSGCGKSFAARILRALVDPCTSPLSPTPPVPANSSPSPATTGFSPSITFPPSRPASSTPSAASPPASAFRSAKRAATRPSPSSSGSSAP